MRTGPFTKLDPGTDNVQKLTYYLKRVLLFRGVSRTT